jgi:LCP family protein required for cell wall assembly
MTHHSADTEHRTRLHRIFNVPNVISIGTGLVAFALLASVLDTNIGIIISAIGAGALAGGVWLLIARYRSAPDLKSTVADLTLLGAIPSDDSGPAPALSDSDTSDRYTGLLGEIEGHTTGRVLLVSSAAPGHGASTVAMNLAIAAARAGRRVMLVDADSSPNGLGRFLSSGRSPGLSDVASGDATLAEATRMWTLDDGTSFPMLPSGENPTSEDALAGLLIAEALDNVSEHADLILIDVPPVLWSKSTPELGRHADGTILVLSDNAQPAAVSRAISNLADIGAPAVGYVRNRSDGTARLAPTPLRSSIKRAATVTVSLLVVYAVLTGLNLWSSWRGIETQAFDQEAVQALAENVPGQVEDVELEDGAESSDGANEVDTADAAENIPETTAPEQAYDTFLLIGGDEVSGAADVILYLVLPTNSADPFMVSLPRDLWVDNLCTGDQTRINSLIHGCESKGVNGPTLLASQVGAFTGIEVDHFAMFDFDGFSSIIDAAGGVEICVDAPVRDEKSKLSLPAGCTNATGEQALAWVRSRHTEQKTGGVWRSVPGAGDLLRNQHQQDVIIELFKELQRFDSPTGLTASVSSLADTFVLDDQLGFAEAVDLAWRMRSINLEDINRLEIPVRLARSKSGQSILIATESFDKVLITKYGGQLPQEDTDVPESYPLNQDSVE